MKVYGLCRLTKDPEHTNGTTRLSIAWNNYSGEGHFFNAVAFRKTGELLYEKVRKGERILITDGVLANNNYTNNDGVMVYGNQIVINQFDFIEPKSQQAPKEEKKVEVIEVIDNGSDLLPF